MLSHSKRVFKFAFETVLLSRFTTLAFYYYFYLFWTFTEKTDNLCLNISGFVVVLSFGDWEGGDFVSRPNSSKSCRAMQSATVGKKFILEWFHYF